MANHKRPIPVWLSNGYIENIIVDHFYEPRLRVVDMTITPGSKVGENFIGQILRLDILLDRNGKKEDLRLIAKLCPDTKLNESLLKEGDVFFLESSFFLLLQTKMEQSSSKQFAPICYHVDNGRKLILLEDLREKNFKILPRHEFLSLQKAKRVVNFLAAFNGATYKVLRNNPHYKDVFKHSFWSGQETELNKTFFKRCCTALKLNIDKYNLSENHKTKLLGLEEKVKLDYFKVCGLQDDRLNFILHGDPQKNNILFRFTNDGATDDIVMVDYQMVYYNSFANDLHYFVFNCLQADVAVNHIDDILEEYYQGLKFYAPEIPNVTFERIKTEFYERLFFGFIMAVMFRSNFVGDIPPDMDKVVDGEMCDEAFKCQQFIDDLQIFLPFFERHGVF